MKAIYMREMKAYFTTAIGYVFIAVFFALSGAVFCFTTLYQMTSAVTSYFTYMLLILAVLLPVLTMKTFSEERKQRTEQLLLTAPVSLYSMVAGKFLASSSLYAGCLGVCSLSFIILTFYGKLKPAVLLGNIMALLLVGLAFIAIGLFVSSCTENQLAAAIGTVGIILAFLAVSLVNQFIPVLWIRNILSALSVFSRFQNFAQGAFDFASLFYYISISAVFLYLTVRVYERRRYS